MSSLGHVESCAITGGDSPVFEKHVGPATNTNTGGEVASPINKEIAELKDTVNTLSNALAAFLQAQTPAAPVVEAPVAVEAPTLTPQEKANITKAANKAAAAEAAKGE